MNKFLNGSIVEKIRRFLLSNTCLISLFLLASLIVFFKAEVYGALLFGLIISVILFFSDDIITTTYPFLLLSIFSTKCYNSFDIFIKFWYLAFIPLVALLFHFIYYKRKIVIGKLFLPMFATSIAVTLGGLGKITSEEYFSPVSLFNMFGLGFGMLLIYVLLSSHFHEGKSYKLNQKFTNIMVMAGLFACFMVLHHYLINMQYVLENGNVLAFQWRNNIATFLMITLPFSFYKSYKNRHIYLYLSVLSFGCLLLTGSRSAMVFGTIEYIICVISIMIYDKPHRSRNIIIFSVLTAAVCFSMQEIFDFFKDTVTRFSLESSDMSIRLGLYKRAVEDFLSNPLFGRGIAYMGNRDIHRSAKFALCWYHSLPFQIIGSFGIVGIITYSFQYYKRFKLLFSKPRSNFNITIILSFLGLQMISLVNPGEFSPIPYLLILTIELIMVEKCNIIRNDHIKN